MSKYNLKKGYDLKLEFEPKRNYLKCNDSEYISFHPLDVHRIKTKLLIKEGDSVLIGTPLYIDKRNPDVIFVCLWILVYHCLLVLIYH